MALDPIEIVFQFAIMKCTSKLNKKISVTYRLTVICISRAAFAAEKLQPKHVWKFKDLNCKPWHLTMSNF